MATKTKTHKAIPYGDEVRFYIDSVNKTAVPVWISSEDYNKGWSDVQVGEFTAKSRYNNRLATKLELLREHYPQNTQERSFYEDLSYHSGLNQGTAGKVDNYGVDSPYMVQFSRYKPVEKYKLLYPVKTSAPSSFGKERKSVTAYDWEYIVNQWSPGGTKGRKWSVEHKIKHADGKDEKLYTSPETDDEEKSLKIFNDRVVGAGGKPYRIPSNLQDVFIDKWDKLEDVREGTRKIRRTTGRHKPKLKTYPMMRGMR